jgi:hypothetical protein
MRKYSSDLGIIDRRLVYTKRKFSIVEIRILYRCPLVLFWDPIQEIDWTALVSITTLSLPFMRLLGFLLLLSGWLLVLAALLLLRPPLDRSAFVTAGIGVEVLGLILVARAHRLPKGDDE